MSLPEALFWSVVVICGMPAVWVLLLELLPSDLDILKLKKENHALREQLEKLQKDSSDYD